MGRAVSRIHGSASANDLTFSIFLRTPSLLQDQLPTRQATENWVREGRGSFRWPDANAFIYMMELSNGFDAWSQLDRIHCPVLIINMAGDNMVPVELHHAEKVLARLKNATYLQINKRRNTGMERSAAQETYGNRSCGSGCWE